MVVNPAVEVHLESSNRRVDVIAEGFDVAIRVRFPPLEPTDLVTAGLGMPMEISELPSSILEGDGTRRRRPSPPQTAAAGARS